MQDNPFILDEEDLLEENPFSDPAIERALQSHSPSDHPLAVASDEPLPPTSRGDLGDANSRRMEAELRRREAELSAREQALSQQEQTLRSQSNLLPKPPNYPPFYPLIFHDINVEIPEEARMVVRFLYWSWLALIGTLVWNALSTFLILVSHAEGVVTGATDFGGAFVYCFTITAASFFLWYRPIYNAFMKERSLYYYFYFVFNGLHIAFAYYMVVGIPGSGSAGLINTISMLSAGRVVAGIFGLVDTILWAGGASVSLWLYRQVYAHYQRQGHTFADAKGDALKTMVGGGAASHV